MALGATSATAPPPPPAASTTRQQAQLTRLVSKYKTDVARNADPGALASLARQIAVASKALGQNVALPKAPAAAAPAAVDAGPAQAAAAGKVDLKT